MEQLLDSGEGCFQADYNLGSLFGIFMDECSHKRTARNIKYVLVVGGTFLLDIVVNY